MPPEKPGLKRAGSHVSAGLNQTTISSDNESISEETIAELTRQKV
jgi:hypothetical protein